MTTEPQQPWRAEPIPESFECYSLYDPTGFDVGTMFSREEASRLPDYLNALEACAEALRWMLDGRTNDPFTLNRATELLARLDAQRP